MLLKTLGKYEIKDWLGGGRFGDVFLAHDTLLDQDFALKISRMRQEEIIMLRDEAKLLASLNHPNIVRFYNIDVIDRRFVLVMEYIKGCSLREIIKEGGIEVNLAFDLLQQILDALSYAHQHNVLHRDLKPENILITNEQIIKITDFGLARFIKSGSISASTAGTPIYMAPEAWQGSYTEKSDMWSIGAVLYELLTGTPPYLDDNLDGLRKKIEKSKLLIPSILRPNIPEALENAVLKCLSPEPKVRPGALELLKKITKKSKGIKIESAVSLPEKKSTKIELTQTQNDVITALDGKILLLGQAGCGKTTTLTHGVLKLMEKGIPRSKILIGTFTNKAANDIKTRLQDALSAPCYDLWLGTFHAIGMRILRHDAERIDISEDFTVQEPRRIFSQVGITTGKHRANAVIKFIEMLKAKGIMYDEFKPAGAWEEFCRDIYKKYADFLRENDILDYDDLILYTIKLLEDNNDLKKFYQDLFEYIFVDELQDINPAQYRLITLLVKNNVFLTGDEDQAIYGWRGAEKELIYRAARDFKDIRIFTLNRSFRLPQAILEIANNLMDRESTVIPNLDTGDVFVYAAKSEDDEVNYLVNEIKNIKNEGFNYRDITVLYRMNYLSRKYEEKLAKARIPYALISGAAIYENAHVKAIIEYFEMLSGHELSIDDFQARAAVVLKVGIRNAARAKRIFEYHWNDSSKLAPSLVIEDMSTLAKFEGEDYEEILGIARSCLEPGHVKFLSELKLVQELDLVDWTKDAVKLMTVHSAKGLEFPVVFIVSLVEDIFPLAKSMSSQPDLEEERRLCYVAITRAQKKLYLSYPKYQYGRNQNPSRFLVEMFRKR